MKIGNASDFANAMFKTNTGKSIKQQKKLISEKQKPKPKEQTK